VSARVDPTELVELAERAARSAGELLRTRTDAASMVAGADVEVMHTKTSPTDVVTAMDTASERLLRAALLGARPDDGFLGEESAEDVGRTGVRWVVDPIDGTVNYLYDIPQYAVSIGAEVDGQCVAGVVHNPVSGETWTAVRGHGARLGDRVLPDVRGLRRAARRLHPLAVGVVPEQQGAGDHLPEGDRL